MNIWDWLYDSIEEHSERGDDSRRELYSIYRAAYRVSNSDPEAAFGLLDEGRRRSAELKDDWWRLFFEHWKLQNLINKQRDYAQARELAARVALEARKPAFAQFPQRVCLQEDLINSFIGIDPRGHARLVEDALAYMEKEVTPDVECYLCLQGLKRDFLFDCGKEAEALAMGRKCLAEVERADNDHHLMQSLVAQCELILEAPYALEELLNVTTLQEGDPAVPVEEGWVAPETFWARLREIEAVILRAQQLAEKLQERDYDAEIEMWLAHVCFFLGRDEEGSAHFKRAIDLFNSQGQMPTESFFRTWLATYWQFNSFEQCLRLVQSQQHWIEGKGQLAREAKLVRQECSFKLALGQLETADLERARQKIALLGAPEHESSRLDEIEESWKAWQTAQLDSQQTELDKDEA